MDIPKLAKEIGNLRYASGYRFESGTPFYYETLREGDIRGLLIALRDRGFIVSHERQTEVGSPPISPAEDDSEQEATPLRNRHPAAT